ncbi:MAG: PQQ-binding-like beta-propeller repeat protein [Dehalococcoidia bacterium]|nr:PQQ-binding-like beta-propeller repeat protein [Dehalococcoidia bacterium]
MTTSPQTPASSESTLYKRCPTCQRLTPADSLRCYECWNDVANVPVLAAQEGIRAIARQTAADLAAQSALERRRAFWRRVRKVTIAFAAGVLTTVLYFGFIYEPPLPPPGSEPGVTMTAEDGTWPIDGRTLAGTRATTLVPQLGAGAGWSTPLGEGPRVPLVAGADLLYVCLEDGRILAIEQATGREAWSHVLANPPVAAPTLASGRLFVPQVSGRLLALDAATGDVVLETPVYPTAFTTSPMIVDGVAYLFGTGAIVALDATTGVRLWTQRVESNWAFVTPVLSGRYIAVATGDRTLIFDRVRGQQTYFYEFERAHPYSIVLAEDTVYSLSSRFGAAIDIHSERPWWESYRKYWNQFFVWGMAPEPPPPPSEWVTSRPPRDGYPAAVGADRLLVAGPTGDVRALSRADGSPIWQEQVDAVTAPPVLTGAGLLLLHPTHLAVYDPGDGHVVASRAMPGTARLESAVVTSSGTYVIAEDGQLTALR